MRRRDLLRRSAGLVGLWALAPLVDACNAPDGGIRTEPVRFDRDPFTLGVASGDPLPDGVVLWTRLAPDPLKGGVDAPAVAVDWEIARDDGMRDVVQQGTATAIADLAHSVHVEAAGLEPDRWYWYRFRAGGAASPIGRTRTTPAAGAAAERLRFAFASCQNYTQGYYTAHANLAREDLDAVVFLGDYIYEGTARGNVVREYASRTWSFSLADYRERYAQYKSDRDLQASHAAFPWIVTWDDHEVENNYAGGYDTEASSARSRNSQLAGAYQAFYEHLPLRVPRPQGRDLRLYRAASVGDLATFHVLDTRQYRSPEVALCAPKDATPSGYCPASLDPRRTMLGAGQRAWLLDGLAASRARWNLVTQSVRFAQHDSEPSQGARRFDGVDNWMGYVADRQAILDAFPRTRNPVVLSGDSHVNFVYDLKRDWDDPRAPLVGAELLGTSISSEGDAAEPATTFGGSAKNPHLRFFDNHRGYVRCTVERSRLVADFRAVSTVRQPTASIRTLASFAVEDGRPGAQRASS